jgi:hypothetical protein
MIDEIRDRKNDHDMPVFPEPSIHANEDEDYNNDNDDKDYIVWATRKYLEYARLDLQQGKAGGNRMQ